MKKDYVDNDVAYLLGMLFARGALAEEKGGVKRLIIRFPYINEKFTLPPRKRLGINMETAIRLSLDDSKGRINELIGADLKTERAKNEVSIIATLTRNTIAWRDLKMLCGSGTDYSNFLLPEYAFEWPEDILVDFVRGFADTAAVPSFADRDQVGRQRIVLQVQNANWYIPIQLCRIIQEILNIKVEHVLWGHPNFGRAFREHRIRVPAEEFRKIGFGWEYKRKVLEKLIAYDNAEGHHPPKKGCNPKAKRTRSIKPKHRDEKSPKLPPEIRAKHFDACFQICKKLGCKQGIKTEKTEYIFEDAEI